ncbi:MAG TPA: 3-isopropylmalate dehydratase small subunit [Pyrinomonadaceae bacterium]|nr:3-isopropylmalate dehydratase small subunit [Pyrinomonadaceae bacterium]
MNKFTKHVGLVAPLYQANIDTDQIIPKQFLKSIERTGFGQFLFYDWRFDENGVEKPDFVLNQPRYKNASILLAGKNFGCGSSREHAPWSLEDFGFRVVIASAFADIFYNNCFKVGILPVILDEEIVAELVEKTEKIENYQITVDLENCKISDEHGFEIDFSVDEFRRFCLLNGLDDIGLTLQHETAISEFENQRPYWKNLPQNA